MGVSVALTACGQASAKGGAYTIDAAVSPEMDDFMAYIVDYDSGAKIDSVVVANGHAKFKGNIDKPAMARLMVENERLGSFILEPGTLTYDAKTQTVKGSPLNTEMDRISESLNAIAKEFNALPDSVRQSQAAAYQLKYENVADEAFKRNANNPIGYYFFLQDAYEMDLAQLEQALKEYPQFASSKRITKLGESLKLKQETSVGHKFKDFSVTYEGKTQKLSDYVGRGKYVLVDFWASWCGPCIRETAVIKELLKEYGPKGLEVLGVAVWDAPEATKRAIAQHQLPWPQIMDAQTIPTDLYGISGIPCIILFDPEGNIISRDKQDDDLRADVKAAMEAAAEAAEAAKAAQTDSTKVQK